MMKNSTPSLFNNIVIAVLVILNLVMLAFVWQSRGPNGLGHHPPERNRGFIPEELGFNDDQTKQFHQLRENHFKTTQPLLAELKELRSAMFDQLKTDRDSALVEEYAARIGQDQAKLESKTYHHFLQIRNICTTDQQVLFDDLLGEIIRPPRDQGPPGHRGGPPPR